MSGLTSAPTMLVVVLAGLLVSAAPDVEQARTDFERGAALYRAGNYREALAAFQEAQAKSPAPQGLFNIARCHERLGEFADAVEAYRAYLAAAPAAPDRATVTARIEELQRRLPLEASLRVAVEPEASVSVDDGSPQPSPVSMRLAPGRHRVSARRSGYGPVDRDVDLAPGARVQLELSLVPLPVPAEVALTRAPEAAVRDTVKPPPQHRGERRWTYVAAGAAAVSLTAGILFGVSAQQAQDTLRDGTSRSQEQVQQIYDSASARRTAANGFYAAAGVCGAAALALFFLEPGFGAPAGGR